MAGNCWKFVLTRTRLVKKNMPAVQAAGADPS